MSNFVAALHILSSIHEQLLAASKTSQKNLADESGKVWDALAHCHKVLCSQGHSSGAPPPPGAPPPGSKSAVAKAHNLDASAAVASFADKQEAASRRALYDR